MESFSLIAVCGTYMSEIMQLVWFPLGKAPMETDSYLARTGRPWDSIEICKIVQLTGSFLFHYIVASLGIS